MNLQALVTKLGARVGLNVQEDVGYATAAALINDAAREIWQATDLPNSLVEESFQTSEDAPLRMTLPARVGQIRGFRNFMTAMREITNAVTPVVESIGTVDVEFTITIIGATSQSAQYIATYTHATDGTVTGPVVNFTEITKIYKSLPTPVDVTITSDDVVLSVIPAWADTARYFGVQCYETAQANPSFSSQVRDLECLYKPPFIPLNFAESTFQLDGYDDAIVWQAQALHWFNSTDAEKIQVLVPLYTAKSKELIAARIRDVIQAREQQIQFGAPRFDTAKLRNIRRYRYANS